MKQHNIYCINGRGDESKILIANNVLTSSFTNSSGGTFYYFVSIPDWLSFKNSSLYEDKDLAYCLAEGLVPGQCELVGGAFIIETI